MVQSFGVPHKDIPFYVGITFACFSLSQVFTGIFWGRASDRFGRKPIMLLGMSGSLLCILAFGFSTSLPMAIFARCFSGLVNGNARFATPVCLDSQGLTTFVGWNIENYGG